MIVDINYIHKIESCCNVIIFTFSIADKSTVEPWEQNEEKSSILFLLALSSIYINAGQCSLYNS